MEITETLFTVALRDFPELPSKDRISAEARYIRVLEKHLGSPEALAETLQHVMALEEADGAEVNPAGVAMVNRWTKAANAARQAGYQGLAEVEGAYFAVRLV